MLNKLIVDPRHYMGINSKLIQRRVKVYKMDTVQPRVKSYLPQTLIISILSLPCLCSLPTALLSVYYSSRVELYHQDYKQASHYSRITFILLLISTLITSGLYLLLIILVIRLSGPF